MESITSTSLVNLIKIGGCSLRKTRENPSDFPHPASPLLGQALQGSSEKDYFNMFHMNSITNNVIKEEKEYYNQKVDDLFNLYEDRSNALDLYNIALENYSEKEIILAKIYLHKIEEQLNSVQEEALLLEKLVKMIN
jgi:hypothetical protein